MPHSRPSDKNPDTGKPHQKEPLISTEALMDAPVGIFTTSPGGKIISANQTLARMLGYETPDELIDSITDIGQEIYANPEDRMYLKKVLGKYGERQNLQCQWISRAGELFWVSMHAKASWNENGEIDFIQGFATDITERKQAEEEQERLQHQLLQSQKMESVGRLAGGVAHEFNNMLSIINGYAEMMADVLSSSEPMYYNARKIEDAGKRSAVIIRKLLAFARKQIITPEVMNLNDSVSSMLKMLEKTIGENINLIWKPEKSAWLIKMDFSQLDQVLINLVVNARDAFYEGGEVIIETKNVEFDKDYCAAHPGFVPGQYVMLAVSDNGCGMSKEVQAHLFEPFFTTKEMGRGTGLGLPTVYGIIKQNNGFVNVYSEPGEGTSFKVYFPRHKKGDAVDSSAEEEKSPVKGNGETILILEDEEEVLGIARLMLEKLGYKVLTAETPNKAMALAEAHLNQIDLLITDIVMPEMNGRDFANQLKELYPEVKILFMSGYTDNVIAHHNMESENLLFIEKPFTLKDISAKVREALLS